MHKLLEIQLKKCFGNGWENTIPSEIKSFLALVDQSYTQFDDDHRLIEHILEVSSKELTEANKDIAKNHELLRSVTESISDLIFYKDLDFRYIGCNQSFAEFFGFSVEGIIGRDDFELYEPQYATLFRTMDQRMLEGMIPRTNREWVKNIAGENILLMTTKAPLVNSKGELFGLVGIARDITKEYHLEQEVKSQQAMLIQQSRLAAMGEMIGNIAHQWRQPLNALGLMVQDLEEAYDFGEMTREYIQTASLKAMEQINYMSQTIEDFRNFFNPDKTKKLFSLHSSINSTIEMFRGEMKKNGIAFTVSVPEDLEIFGYSNEFSQVILNLLHNARDEFVLRNIQKPAIRIEASKTDEQIEVVVADNAGGISEAILPKIFDPYFTTKEVEHGSGIGLYMSKMIIEGHMHGALKAQNIKDGVCFSIVLNTNEQEEHSDAV